MIEAVNSALASAQVLRSTSERSGNASASSAGAEAIVAPQAPYISPYVTFNVDRNVAVLQLRDSETGEAVEQIPSEQTLQRQEQFARSRAAADEVQEILSNSFDPFTVEPSAGESDQSTTQFAGGTNGFNVQQVSTPEPAGAANPQFDAAAAAFSAGARAGTPEQATVSLTA